MSTTRRSGPLATLCALLLIATTAVSVQATDYYSPFVGGQTLSGNDCLYSPSEYTQLCIQSDFSILSFRWIGPGDSYLIWSSNGDSCTNCVGSHVSQSTFPSDGNAHLQYDGNFIIFTAQQQAIWTTQTNDNPDAYVEIDDEGNMAVFDQYGTPVWAIY